MKLTLRLIAALLAATLLVVTIDGYMSISRERDLFLTTMRESAVLLGETIAPLFAEVLRAQGPQRARDLIQRVNRAEHRITTRWVLLDDATDPRLQPQVPAEQIRHTPLDSTPVFSLKVDRRERMAVYVPVNSADSALGWLEMTQSTDPARVYTRETLIRTLILSLALMLLAGAIHSVFGTYFIGRPLMQLMEQTKRIALGNFLPLGAPLGKDELADLAKSLDDMSLQLETSRQETRIQMQRRVAAIEQLRHADRLSTIGRLAAGIAHELGTPLNVISGHAKMIEEGDLTPAESSSSSRVIVEQSQRMAGIIRQLLDSSRLPLAEYSRVELSDLVSRTVTLLRPMAHKGGVQLHVVAAEVLPCLQLAQTQIQQALTNIIVNGIQAMPAGGDLTVTLSRIRRASLVGQPEENKEFAAISVKDEGTGIPAGQLKTVFDPFFTTKPVGTGTGLGLSIAQGIISDHKGMIEVDSTEGHGTTVTILLPLGDLNE